MKEVYFTLPYKRSTTKFRLEYGQLNKKFIIRTFDGKINDRSNSEDSPNEEVFESENEMLKKVDEIKKGLLKSRWVMHNKESFYKPSFLKTGIVGGAISFEFSVGIDPVKLEARKTEIAKDFVENIDKEIETNIRK